MMSSGDHSWRRRLGRSNSNTQKMNERASPPDSVPVAPPSPGNPPIALPPTASLSATPPKKTWERHYKSFLTKRVFGQSPKSSASDEDTSERSGKFPGGRRLFRRSKSGEGLPPQKMPDMPVLVASKSHEDVAIRGGNFFSSVFSRNKSEGAATGDDLSTRSLQNHNRSSDGPVSPSQRRRIKSMDRIKSMNALDTTLKGGLDKAHISPKPYRKKYDDLETPVHGGVPTASRVKGHLPAALKHSSSSASGSGKSREMKKAFTEFHNSATYSVDASSAYLGDDPSIRPANYLAMPKRTSAGGKQ